MPHRSSTTGQTTSSPKEPGKPSTSPPPQPSIPPPHPSVSQLTHISLGSSPPPASSPNPYKTCAPAKATSSSPTPTGPSAGAVSSTARSKRVRGRRWRCSGISARVRRKSSKSLLICRTVYCHAIPRELRERRPTLIERLSSADGKEVFARHCLEPALFTAGHYSGL